MSANAPHTVGRPLVRQFLFLFFTILLLFHLEISVKGLNVHKPTCGKF